MSVGDDGGARYFRDPTTAQVSEGVDESSVEAGITGSGIVSEVAKVGGCNAAEATVTDGVRASEGDKAVEVAEAGGCNAAGAAVARGWGFPCV